MAISLNGADENLIIAEDAALTFPAAGWSLGGWILRPANSNSNGELIGWGTAGASPSVYCRVVESDHASLPGRLYAAFEDSLGVSRGLSSGTTRVDDGVWHHVLWVNDGSDIYCYVDGVEANSNGTLTLGEINVAESMYLGSTKTGGNWYTSAMGDWGFWTRALGSGEITALAAGQNFEAIKHGLAWCIHGRSEIREVIEGLGVTNNSGGFTAHPTVANEPDYFRRRANMQAA